MAKSFDELRSEMSEEARRRAAEQLAKLKESDGLRCSRCGKPTTFDPVYGDLCYRCCRADNE